MNAGGSFEITISIADSVIVYKNVMLGEVWLCSGQSNMEIPRKGWPPGNLIQNSESEIQQANYPNIRLFTSDESCFEFSGIRLCRKMERMQSEYGGKVQRGSVLLRKKTSHGIERSYRPDLFRLGRDESTVMDQRKYLGELADYKPIAENISSDTGEVSKLNDWIRSHPEFDINMEDAAHQYENLDFGDSACSTPNV